MPKHLQIEIRRLEKRILTIGATVVEAIQKALRKAVDDRQIEDALDRLLREGRFRTIYR